MTKQQSQHLIPLCASFLHQATGPYLGHKLYTISVKTGSKSAATDSVGMLVLGAGLFTQFILHILLLCNIEKKHKRRIKALMIFLSYATPFIVGLITLIGAGGACIEKSGLNGTMAHAMESNHSADAGAPSIFSPEINTALSFSGPSMFFTAGCDGYVIRQLKNLPPSSGHYFHFFTFLLLGALCITANIYAQDQAQGDLKTTVIETTLAALLTVAPTVGMILLCYNRAHPDEDNNTNYHEFSPSSSHANLASAQQKQQQTAPEDFDYPQALRDQAASRSDLLEALLHW